MIKSNQCAIEQLTLTRDDAHSELCGSDVDGECRFHGPLVCQHIHLLPPDKVDLLTSLRIFVPVKTDWNPVLKAELSKPYFAELQQFITEERRRHRVYPADADVFAALHTTSYADTKVLILGQDPYHGDGQAHGLAFSVQHGVVIPPSLRNIYSELRDDLGVDTPSHGCLTSWAQRGVLLLNTTLTVRAGQAGSHQGKGWEQFTDEVITAVAAKADPVVFILWGASARRKRALITGTHHTVLEAPHPSPLSAHNGFFGSKPFSQANAALVAAGREPIDWSL